MNYTKKQHYISRYILRRFLNKKGKIDAILLQSPSKRIQSPVENICAEKDFYEDKDVDGNYINRNHTENKFANMEDILATWVDKFICILDGNNRASVLRKMIESAEYEIFTIWLMFHLTIVLIRLPVVKNIVSKKDAPFEIRQLFYKSLLWGDDEAVVLAENLFEDVDLQHIKKVFDGKTYNGGINTLMNHLINNYYIEIYEVPRAKKLYLTDNPVIINDITEIDYFLPLSSKYAIALKRLSGDKTFNMHYSPLIMTERMVDSVNRTVIKNASIIVIAKDMTDNDEQFIKESVSGKIN